jgi:hypothetical protein
MKLGLPKLSALNFGKIQAAPEVILERAWAILFMAMFLLLAVDGLVFYLYGLGRATPPPNAAEQSPVFREEVVERTAATLRSRDAAFRAASSTADNLPNPFPGAAAVNAGIH